MRISPEDLEYLQRTAVRVLESCRTIREIACGGPRKQIVLYLPSGDLKYPSFWIRDAALMAESGLIPPERIAGWLDLIAAAGQNGPAPLRLENGLLVPPWSIADHVNFDGNAVYFPGTYNAGADQGDGRYGYFPPHDNPYYFVRMAYICYALQKETDFCDREYGGLTLLERLEKAFAVPQTDPDSQLCESDPDRHTVDWGFCDQIKKSGLLLFPSLLRYQAALNLSELFTARGATEKAATYVSIAARIKESLIERFYDASGWLLSATGTGRQKDVWGTAFAVWLGIAAGSRRRESGKALAEAFQTGAAVRNGYVRGILAGEDKTDGTAWEDTFCPYQTYQNGGYWATPTGWYIDALALADPSLAAAMARQFIAHTRANEPKGAPFEWRSADDAQAEGKWYGASAALPYAAIRRLGA